MSETPSTSYSVNQANSSESEQSVSTRHFNVTEPVVAKRICFYKSGDPQFNGIKMVVNSRSYKTFDALLDSLSKRVPLPFGVRNISTPKGRHSITNLEDLEDGKSYICSHQRKMKPINLEQASRKPLPWQISRPVSARRRAVQLAKENEDGYGHRDIKITTPKKMLVFKNGDVRLRRTVVLGKKNTQTFEAFLDYMSELMQYPVVKLYTTDGRKVPNLQALILCSGAVVAAGREPFKPSNYDSLGYSRPAKLLGIANRIYPKANAKSESENTRAEMGSSSRSQIFSVSSDKGSSNDNNSDSSYVPDSHNGIGGNQSVTGEGLSVAQYEDDIVKSVHLNQDGSVTVEMKVRLKIKEEETIKWTTTVSRAGLSDDQNAIACNSAVHADHCLSNGNVSECVKPKDAPFLKSYNKEEGDSLQQFNAEGSDKESESDLKTADCIDCKKNNSAGLDVSNEPEDNIRPRFYRPPTPGPRRVRQKKAVVESVTLVSEKEVQEKTIGQFSYSEEVENGENKSEYCMVAHSSRKKSSVINPKFSEMSDNDLLKLSSENIKEEMLFKVSHRSSDLIETTNRKTLEVSDEDELVSNILEKSVVEQGTYNSLVSTYKANISGFRPSSKTYQAARPVSADHIQESCDIKQIKRSLSSFIRYSELCQSKEETKCKAADLLPVSQDSVHSPCSGHSQMKMMVHSCSKTPTEKINPTTGFFPTVTESENQISVESESVTPPHLTDDSQSASSITKKKKKRKSSNFLKQGTYENQKDKDIIKCEGMHITSKTTQVSTTEAMGNYSEMPQKNGMEYFVKNKESVNSEKIVCLEDEFCHQDSGEQNGLSSNKKPRSNNKKLAKVKLKSGKKNSIVSSSKSHDGVMTVDSNNESQHSLDTVATVKEGSHLTTDSYEQTLNSSVVSKPLSEVPKNLNFEEKENSILENLSSKKQKKEKGMKKNLSKGVKKLNVSERAITLEALKQEDFQPVVEHSLENYVQSWLKNLLPNSVLPPIKKREGNVENSSDCHFPGENSDVSVDKETSFITNEVHVTEEEHLIEHNLTKKTLKPICELGTLEESAKDSGENQADSLIHANTTIVEAAKYKLHVFHETQDKDKKMSEDDIQDTNLYQSKKSEVAVQVDCTIINDKMGIDLQNNCVSSMLLHELQSTLLGLQKEHSGCIGKACRFSELSPSTFGSSSNVLLAWLLVLNLRESLIGTIKDDLQKTTCSCSEIFTQLQLLKQTTVTEKVDELKAAFSHFQQPTENSLLHFGRELKTQDSAQCHENIPISEIHNGIHLHDNEKSVERCIPKDSVNSEEALKSIGELESCFDTQEHLCGETETLDLSASKTQLDGQYANTNSNTCSLASAIETPERNEEMPDSLCEKYQDKDTDTSFTYEESETSVEPYSTVHSVTSNDKNCILDQDTSEVEGEKCTIRVATEKTEDEKDDPKSAGNDENSNNQLKLAAETSVEYNNEDYSIQEDKEDTKICEETSERLSTISPLSFCYESKQITECDMSEGEQKLQVKEVDNKRCSDPSQLKKCLKSPATSDWSDYRPDSEDSDDNLRASSDLTNESGDEALLEKHYNTGYVKRTIERLYGKTEASFKPDFHKGFPYLSKALQKDTEEFHFSKEFRSCSAEKLSHSSQEFSANINKGDTISREENNSVPTPQSTRSREETCYTDDPSGESPMQHCQPSVRATEDEGILIDKGKWLLKENHLIRRSPPEQVGMYGNLDTTSTDTVRDTNSDDIPYSHFGNPNQYPVLDEISSSELEDMAKPSENFCNYFNIPHNSDSDPFQDDFRTKNKRSCSGKSTSLPAANKEKSKPSVMVGSASTQADTNFPAFTSVEFRLHDNKVHPLEQPLNDEPVRSQPADVSNASRSALREEDSLDKLHAICGQHCPILMVTVTPINEEQRGCAYQKASDIENQLAPCLLPKKCEYLQWSGEDLITDKNNCVTLKNNCISKIANNIFNRFYANNTLDFISNFGILASSSLKDPSGLGKLHVIEDMNVKPEEVSNCQNNVSSHIPSDLVIGTSSELPNRNPKICQTLRISLILIVGEKFPPMLADPAETCHSETFLKCDTSLNNTERNASDNLKNENAFPTEEDEAEVCFSRTDNGNSKDDFKKWKVSVLTSDVPSAGTTSKVYITLYGDHSSSGPFFLDGEEGKLFQRGNEDIFTINTGNIGHLYKIRVGHTNTGKSPAWHCEEVQLLNLFSGEQFFFPAHRWLAWDQADGAISLELPVFHQGQPILPVTVYEVHVTTGELWNAGTEADVYIAVYGERGDTGSRQLLRSQKQKKFLKGQTDIFAVEAVHLGHLYKIVIGHNGLGSGNGWFLDKVVIKDPVTDLDYTFLCHRWLDQGQDDGNIARELTVADAGMFPGSQELELKTEETWAAEKWKFQEGNTLQFYNRLTHGFICLSPDSRVDALGDKKNKYGLFDVNVKGRNRCIFSSHKMPRLALALVNGHVIGKSKDKACCELCIHLQPNGCAILESARSPGHTVTFNLQGTIPDETTGYAGLCKEFVVHVKGVFHHGAIILLNTSLCQALSLRPDGSCSGAGRQQQESYWKVHKISSGVCMFESVRNPRMYLKIKDDHCNGTGTGDEYCHFKIEKNLETGSVSLESVQNKGIYVGLLPDGQTKPVIDTGERNIFFYPQVIKFGREEPMGTSAAPNQEKKDFRESQLQPEKGQKPVSQNLSTFPLPKEMRNPQGGECPLPSDDEWKVSMLTGNAGTEANVILWIYGDRGVAGPITLGKDNRKQLFLPRQEVEFQVKIKSIGNIYKIRIELDEVLNEQSEWNLQRVTLQHLKSKKTLDFPTNTWLSKNCDGRDFLCELPVVEAGKPVYPIVLYHVYVYTGDVEQEDTDSSVYLCIYGKRGDSGLRLLQKSGIPMAFQRGMVNAFGVEAVSLGKLRKVLLRCEANASSRYWYCDKVVVREAENNSEYVFNCERWLPFMSQGVIHSEIELYPQEFQINQQLKMQEAANDGDWKITVVTGDFETAGTTATVSLYAYGENRASGPIILGSGKHQLFNPNSEDTFKVNLRDLGQLYKIRIGHDNTGNDPGWYLEEVRLERVVPLSDEEICLPIECWLAEDKGEGDTWREVAIRNPTKELLPLLVYEVRVYTGANLGAETDSNVYINLIGTRGDAGKRKLHRSKNNYVKFRRGQMDIFCIKAVSLGDLEKVLISHDGAGPGSGWFLDKIVIKYEEGREAQEVVFPCNRWLDEYQDDGKTERELTARKDGNSMKAFLKAQQWRVQVKTDGDSPEPQECKRTLVIYGSKGKSDELLLSPRTPGYVCFLPRATDEFIVETGDLGAVYKIRVSCDGVPGFEGWHLKSFRLEELHTKQELNFDCNCWLSLNREDKELVKEFPAVNEDQKTLPVYKYVVSLHIGDRWGAETFANVCITLYGKRGDTGVRKLHTSLAKGRKFQRNQVDSFLVEAVSLSHLQKVLIEHDGEGYGAGMYLKMVTVKESQDSDKEWVFPLWNWLDTHLGLCETACEIVTVGTRLTSSPKLSEINIKPSGLWIMDITGSDWSNEEDPICLSFIFYGNLSCKKLPLQVTGKAIQIKDELADIGSIYKVQITGPRSELNQPWHLDSLHMKHTGTKEEMCLAFDCWFNPNEDKCVELPALYADQEPLPVVEYAVHLHTGDLKKADATGETYLCIQGEKSDSGKRWLNSRNSLITFARGQVDVFKIKAVYLGKLNRVLVGFKSLKKDEWFLEKIVIKEAFYPFSAHVFVHNDWINKRSKKDFVEVAIPLKETSVTSLLTKNFDTKSRGRWQTWVHCTQLPDVPDIEVVVFGRKGKSPAQKLQNLNDKPFLLTVADIGDITKLSFVLSGPRLGRGIKLHKLRLKDLDTKEELGFHTEARCLFGADGSESVTELAAVRPDKPPLREVLYSISIHTGTLPASGTDADVFVTVFGEQGDSCKRRLRHTNFERGQVCVSEMRAVDLGQLSKVLVEHYNVGYGSGWYLDQIVIHESGKTDGQYAFLCQQWLDSGVGDAQTERMLKLLGKVRNGILTGKIYGTWDVLVTTSDISSSSMNPKMSLTVCGEKGTCASVIFPKGSLKNPQIYETSIELNKKFNTIFKVRLEIEEAGDGETWHCREIKLQQRESKNVLEFPFCRSFADEEGARVAELPVLTAGSPFPAVKSYVLYITTGATPGSGTDADVYVKLQGFLGDTGRRKLFRKGDDNFTKGKVDVFQVEAVDVGILQGLVVEKGKGSDWLLEKITVKESAAAGKETLFMAQTWLKDRRNGKRFASVTLNATEIQERRSTSAWPLGKEQMNSEGRWRIYFTKQQEETKPDIEKLSESISKLVMVFYGSNGKSNPVSVENRVEHQAKNQITYDIHLPSDLGTLYKVRLGLQSLENSVSQLSLHHFKMQNTSTLDTFSLTINKTLPFSLNGDRWIEFPIEWPLKEALSVVMYHLTVYSRNILSERNLVRMSVCIYGTHGDTGNRSLLWSLQNVQQGEDNESFLVTMDAVELGELDKVVLLISSKTDCKLDIKKLHLKEAVKEHPIYVFEVNEAFSVNADMPEIEREIPVSFVIREDKKNYMDNKLHKESQARNLTEYTIKVYTGDKRGAGTDANVHIILFGNEDKSEVFQLSQSLEHQDPFERGKVDTFKIKTNKLGSLRSIEIGHDRKGFASGWYLEKVEITDASRNSVYCFNCNRWLAEDERDGDTVVQLYPEVLDS